jgi:hypothetical protein
MGRFKATIDELELKELSLHRRKFTWSSSQNSQSPQNSRSSSAHASTAVTMTKIDRFFSMTAWEELFPTVHLHAWASMISDHCPLILRGATDNPRFKGFWFESYWPVIPGFVEIVEQTWNKLLQATDAVQHLHIKLSRTAKALKQWEKSRIGNIKIQLKIVKEVIWLLDQAQERRALSHEEIGSRTRLKEIYLGLITVEKIKARQRSRLTHIRYHDTNTKLFFLKRKRGKQIQFLQTADGLAMKHEDKAKK